MECIISCIVAFLTILFIFKWIRRRLRLPPGPRGIPFIGNILQIDTTNPMPTVYKWRKEFGDIFKIKLIGQDIVVVSSLELVRDVLIRKQDTFSGRPAFVRARAYFDFKEDVAGAVGLSPSWKIKKRALHTSLKMYGEELYKLETVTLECIQDTVKEFKERKGKPFNPAEPIHRLVEDILAILLYSEKLSEDTLTELIYCQDIFQKRHISYKGLELELLPWLRYFGIPIWKEVQQNKTRVMGIYSDMVKKRKEVLDVENPQCVIDGLLVAQLNEAKENNGKIEIFDDHTLSILLFNLFEAGGITTKNNTVAFIAIMANHPNLQKKLHREIDRVIGSDQPRLQDRHQMHFTSACIIELMRYASITPFLIPHMATKDGELGSYFIPKGTQVWCSITIINHDLEYWEDPWEFRPERFLDEKGHLVTPDHPNRRRSLAFGAGQRSCVGEVLAKNRIFLFIASLFQHFKFLPTEGKMAPNHDPRSYHFGIVSIINDFEIIAKPRLIEK